MFGNCVNGLNATYLPPGFFDNSHSPHVRHCFLTKFYPHLHILITSPIARRHRVAGGPIFTSTCPPWLCSLVIFQRTHCNTHDTLPRSSPLFGSSRSGLS